MTAGGRFQLDMEALAHSVSHVAGQAEDLATAHLASDNQMEAAQPGLVGTSAAALNIKAAEWLETSRRLLTRVGGHATDLNSDGIAFATQERENNATLRAAAGGAKGPPGTAGA
jgi:hypothetical protein